jgi:hypothetical protein
MSLGSDARLRTPSLRSLNCFAAVPTPESTITLCRQVRSLGHRRRATAYAIHRNHSRPAAILGKLAPCCQLLARGVTEPLRPSSSRRSSAVSAIGVAVGTVLIPTLNHDSVSSDSGY